MRYLKYLATAILSCGLLVVLNLAPVWIQRVQAVQSHGHYGYVQGSATTSIGQYFERNEYLNQDAAAAFKEMQSAAAAQGINIGVISGYRSISDQQGLFARQIQRQGSADAAARISAPAGFSEHHTGYALDVRDLSDPGEDLKTGFDQTAAFRWMKANAAKYGFEMSFPAGNAQGVSYEPWHWRFVGSAAAKKVFAEARGTTPAKTQPKAQPKAKTIEIAALTPPADAATTSTSPVGQNCSLPSNIAPKLPNMNQISFGNLALGDSGGASASGAFTREITQQNSPASYSWGKGQPISQVMSLGDIQQLQPQQLTLNQIGQKTNTDVKSAALSTFALIGVQTVGSLADAVPGLPEMPVKALQPFADTINRGGKAFLKALLIKKADTTLAQLLKIDPAFAKVPLNRMALQQYAIASIPGLADTPLSALAGWESSKIAGVPGLSQLPISQFPGGSCLLASATTPIGIIDNVFGPNEAAADYHSITGSDVEGFRVPCKQQNCAYTELRDPLGAGGPLHQARWIKGGKPEKGGQMVKGGHGVLGKSFGGKEPTGRLPFGAKSNIKLVLTDTNESSGRADFSLYMRVCKDKLGCTPFMFGPIPFMTVHEGDKVLVGFDDRAAFSEPNVKVPDSVRREIEQVNESYGDSSPITEDCSKATVSATESGYLETAQQYVPTILKEAQKAGLTPSQTAYVLATARHESGMGKFMAYMGDRSPYGQYYARGFVGLTHDYNYRKWSQILGIDLLKNPDKAEEPDIAARILVEGMKRGEFTGYKLADYINGTQNNFFDARAVINGVKDGAGMYAATASRYEKALKSCASAIGSGSCGSGGGGMIRSAQGPAMSEFGMRLSPTLGVWALHAGIDIGAGEGQPIVAADCGKVTLVEWESGYGNSTIIQHSNGLYTRYAHQSAQKVRVGQVVQKGQLIGLVGSTGRVTGPHLHFEVRKTGPWGEPQNPRNYVNF